MQKLFYFFLAIFSIIYLFRCFSYLDPDIGWHLKMGQIILHQGIPKTDPFSYSMPSYPFVDHEWLTNVTLYLLYSITGFTGLTILFSGVTLASAYIPIAAVKPKWSLFPSLLVATSLAGFMGIRTQVLSWFFFAILLQILLNKHYFVKFKWCLPVFILIWSNMHGSFGIGIVMVGLFLTLRHFHLSSSSPQPNYASRIKNYGFKNIVFSVINNAYFLIRHCKLHKKDANIVSDLILFISCIAVTFITPYGWRIWWEVWMQLSDTGLKSHIEEWFPAFNFTGAFSLWLLIALSVILTWQYRKMFSLFEKTSYVILLLFGVSSMRQMPFWFIIALPMTAKDILLLFEEASKHPITEKNFAIAYKIFFIIVITVCLAELTYDYMQTKNLSEAAFYPAKAVVYLQSHPSNGNIFSHYDFGGYLIWKLPGKKVFVDGRMPSWRWQAPKNESNDAFLEWEDIGNGKIPFAKAEKKYNIDTVLWFAPNNKTKPALYESAINSILHLFKIKTPPEKDFISELPKDGFVMVYKDNVAVIYMKK